MPRLGYFNSVPLRTVERAMSWNPWRSALASMSEMTTKIHAHLDRHFVGYARISIDDIDFESGRDKDNRNVKRLAGILERSCERDNPANAVSVVVEKGPLTEAQHKDLYSSTGVSLIPSQLPFLHTKVVCLHGKHRIFAAREILSSSDRWWIAKIFDSGRNTSTESMCIHLPI